MIAPLLATSMLNLELFDGSHDVLDANRLGIVTVLPLLIARDKIDERTQNNPIVQ